MHQQFQGFKAETQLNCIISRVHLEKITVFFWKVSHSSKVWPGEHCIMVNIRFR